MPLDRVSTPAGGDDLASTDEVKVYKDEGEEDENKASENLSEDKIGLVTETEEVKNSEEEHPHFLRNSESGGGTHLLGSVVDYRIGGRLPFGYPLLTPYPYSYGSPLGLGGISINTGGLPFYMCNNDVFSNPASLPPAHLGLSPVPWHLPTHTGLPPRSPFLYGIVAPSSPPPSSSILSLPSPYRQFPHPFYTGDLANPIGWSNPSISLTSAYHMSRIGHRPCSSSLLGAPVSPGTLCPHPRVRSSLRGGKTSQAQSTAATSAFLGQHRRLFSHHSMDSFSTGSTTLSSSNISISSINPNRRNLIAASSSAKPFLLSPSSAAGGGKLQPHIKKPLNAFMIFMKEMRQRVIDECTLKESAAINQILGRKWHSLDRTEQAKYYELARREKELHRHLYPTWSARDNYALHSRRKRKRLQDDDRTTTDTDDDRECPNAKKCRARFGLDKQNQWCKPCRRKKRCIRFLRESETSSGMVEEGEGEEEERSEVEREATKKEEMQRHRAFVSV